MRDIQNSTINSFFKVSKQKEKIEILTQQHFTKAMDFYKDFEDSLISMLQNDLKQIHKILNAELSKTVRMLRNKLEGEYANQLEQSLSTFYLGPYITSEIETLKKSIAKLKGKVLEYISEFCNSILSTNLQRHQKKSLYHSSNTIQSLEKTWRSVSSRSPVSKAEISVKGFYRPQTSWLCLGVTKSMKEFGPIKKALNKQDFMGNIYLNGTDQMTGDFRVKRDLNNFDVFIVECQNRMVWVYRKNEGKNKKECFIMDDNMEYYIYIAIKGPIQLVFQAS